MEWTIFWRIILDIQKPLVILSYIWRADANWIRLPKTPDFDPFLNDYCPNRSGAQYAGHQKSSLRNEESVGLDSWCISIDIWPKSSYMKPICLHDFWRSIHYLISMFRWSMYEYALFPNQNRFPNQRRIFPTKMPKTTFWKSTWLGPPSSSSVWGGFSLCSALSPFKNLHQKGSEKNGWDWKTILSFGPPTKSLRQKVAPSGEVYVPIFFWGITISGFFRKWHRWG